MNQLPADGEHDLAVPGGVGHQFQHLFVGFALDGNAVYTKQLVSGAQAPVLLSCTQWDDRTDVHLWVQEEVRLIRVTANTEQKQLKLLN